MLLLTHADTLFILAVTFSKDFNIKISTRISTRYLTPIKQAQHLKWQNHIYFEFHALKVPAIWHCCCCCWFDDFRRKWNPNPKSFIRMKLKCRAVRNQDGLSNQQMANHRTTNLTKTSASWTWVQHADIARLKSVCWHCQIKVSVLSRYSIITFPELFHMSSMSKILQIHI